MLEMGRGLRKHLEKKKKMAKTREKFELINDILPAIAEKSAAILERPVPDLAGSITKIMSAVICNESTVWNKETKQSDVSITLFNYTSRARSYSLLVNWPEKSGAEMVANERGGRKEAMGIWGWKIETLEPGEKAVVEYSLGGLEKGDWTETEVFFRGSQDVIGATKLDEKMLVEIRRQEEILTQVDASTEEVDDASEESYTPGVVEGDSNQTTLFGGDV
jgi:DNA topoisomerase-6 subunit B